MTYLSIGSSFKSTLLTSLGTSCRDFQPPNAVPQLLIVNNGFDDAAMWLKDPASKRDRVAGRRTDSLAQVRAYGVGTPDHGLNTYSLIRSPDEARRPRLVLAFPLRI